MAITYKDGEDLPNFIEKEGFKLTISPTNLTLGLHKLTYTLTDEEGEQSIYTSTFTVLLPKHNKTQRGE